MMRSLSCLPLLVATLLLGACASPAPRAADDGPTPENPIKITPRSPITTILLYVPNRVLDAFDVVRAGVDIGPGFGFDAQVTNAARAAYMGRTSVGVGLQTLRHLPFKAGVESDVSIGPTTAGGDGLLSWYRSPADVRFEVHPLLAGAHVAFEPVELVDLIGGVFTADLKDDDF